MNYGDNGQVRIDLKFIKHNRLYISKLIVELSGGTIGLESSEPTKGSTFAFSLPRSKDTAV